MLAHNALADEPARLAALARLAILDTPREEPFDNVVRLVRSVLGVPISAVTLVDKDRQWFKAIDGLDATETPRSESFCAYAIQQDTPMLIPDARLDTRVADYPSVTEDPFVRSYAGVPLVTADGYNVGALCAVDTRPREFTDGEMDILRNFARIVVNEMELRRIADRDQLTGALTRRGFLEKVNHEIARCRRHGRTASLALIDVDRFKTVNDTWGHPAGDKVLRELASTLERIGRSGDILGRVGGEEFAILLPETGVPEALAAVERFRAAIAALPIAIGLSQTIAVTASFGVAMLDDTITVAEEWLALADVPLYAAKRLGRNRCEMA
ncbi:sensor domain-containing diguanylate cyclase [Novosphingobium sp. Leaf2]|uniref:sensor domain-containing diguanylate cyclase n=1 Tax=Novosphingobium sp. Leaf2 TaxID=1735670 RepID=UPI0006F51DB4|nr:sensor domain-containing diguanylate cyclase [Novosphingobium sp. Leaf2]KQM17433.1 diguanylate cyclase [Novosphingobium sp. Leaf2]